MYRGTYRAHFTMFSVRFSSSAIRLSRGEFIGIPFIRSSIILYFLYGCKPICCCSRCCCIVSAVLLSVWYSMFGYAFSFTFTSNRTRVAHISIGDTRAQRSECFGVILSVVHIRTHWSIVFEAHNNNKYLICCVCVCACVLPYYYY